MQTILTVEAMRESDAAAIAGGVAGAELMKRAGRAIFGAASWAPPVAVVCGKGNNGGDGYALALNLAEAGISCTIFAQAAPVTPEAAGFEQACRKHGIPMMPWTEMSDLRGFHTVADCIFGTGFRGEAAGEAARVIRLINASGARVISADINSGLNGDNGLGDPAVISSLTVSIGCPKPGHFLGRAKDVMRGTVNADIGIPPRGHMLRRLEEKDAAAMLPPRIRFSNKGTYGTAALIGGSLPYSGAVRLAAMGNAAMRSGAGIARVAAPAGLCPLVAASVLECTLFPLPEREGHMTYCRESLLEAVKDTRTAVFGMGAGNTEDTQRAVQCLLQEYPGILVLDADGLNALAALGTEWLRHAAGRVILTPHPGEFGRLTGRSAAEVLKDPVGLAESFARDTGAVVLLKGAATVITDGKETFLTDTGCAGMATAGSGDVLSGVLGALCAWRRESLTETTALAAWVNGRAGEIAQARMGDISMTAGDTVKALPEVFVRLRNQAL